MPINMQLDIIPLYNHLSPLATRQDTSQVSISTLKEPISIYPDCSGVILRGISLPAFACFLPFFLPCRSLPLLFFYRGLPLVHPVFHPNFIPPFAPHLIFLSSVADRYACTSKTVLDLNAFFPSFYNCSRPCIMPHEHHRPATSGSK
jgi:hypothetical protein